MPQKYLVIDVIFHCYNQKIVEVAFYSSGNFYFRTKQVLCRQSDSIWVYDCPLKAILNVEVIKNIPLAGEGLANRINRICRITKKAIMMM